MNDRRLTAVLAEVTGSPVRIDDAWGPLCDLPHASDADAGMRARVCLGHNRPGCISLSAFPADTLTQARQFYRRPRAVARVRELSTADGWHVRHSYHFGDAFGKGHVWTHGPIDAVTYLDLWTERIGTAHALDPSEWPAYLDWLIEVEIATDRDRSEFDWCFTNTRRTSASPRPSVGVWRVWSPIEANALDHEGAFVGEVRDAFQVLLELGTLCGIRWYATSGREQPATARRTRTPPQMTPRVESVPGSIGIGSRVRTVDTKTGEQRDRTIVPPAQSDPRSGKISPASPIGQALLGRVIGDVVDVSTPRGIKSLRIIAVAMSDA